MACGASLQFLVCAPQTDTCSDTFEEEMLLALFAHVSRHKLIARFHRGSRGKPNRPSARTARAPPEARQPELRSHGSAQVFWEISTDLAHWPWAQTLVPTHGYTTRLPTRSSPARGRAYSRRLLHVELCTPAPFLWGAGGSQYIQCAKAKRCHAKSYSAII